MRESTVEAHLVKQVKAVHGFVRKLKWVGVRGAPDRFIAIPQRGMWLAELKRPGGVLEDHQAREHVRLMKMGIRVVVLDSIEAVDKFMEASTEGGAPCGT